MMFTVSKSDDAEFTGATHPAANDTMRYREGVGLGRVFLFIGGVGMLFAPIIIPLSGLHGGNAPQWQQQCEQYAEQYPDFDPTTTGCAGYEQEQ